MCKCGCDKCETVSTALVLNESKAPMTILSEGLKHHMDANKPLTNNFYSAGSKDYFDLIAEARSLYSRGILDFTNKRDIELLTETDQGHFGMYEGKKVPLDFPIEIKEYSDENYDSLEDSIAQAEFGMDYDQLGPGEKEWVRDEIDNMSMNEVTRYSGFDRNPEDPDSIPFEPTGSVSEFKEDLRALFGKFKGDLKNPEFIKGVAQIMVNWKSLLRSQLDENKKAKKDNKKLNKPMRDSSGGKAYKVYVKDPKPETSKQLRFGSGGLRAKINDKKARNAFAARPPSHLTPNYLV
jgi:hypothetical protein